MIYFNKILPILVSPMGFVILLLLLGIFRRKIVMSLYAIIILVMLSLPIVSNFLVGELEKNYTLFSVNKLKKADVVVVLSGMVRTIQGADGLYYEFGEAVDRIQAGINIIKSNKANLMILTRGKLPWSVGVPEGEFLAKFAIENGISSKNIALTREVQNTDDEAKAIKEMLQSTDGTMILVTSAFHMPRAQRVFENQGLDVTPYPVDFLKDAGKLGVLNFFPTAAAFSRSNFFVREIIGRLYYPLKY
jgi:uncharacterized SAM-binding protein YcdF (DUF218 family)